MVDRAAVSGAHDDLRERADGSFLGRNQPDRTELVETQCAPMGYAEAMDVLLREGTPDREREHLSMDPNGPAPRRGEDYVTTVGAETFFAAMPVFRFPRDPICHVANLRMLTGIAASSPLRIHDLATIAPALVQEYFDEVPRPRSAKPSDRRWTRALWCHATKAATQQRVWSARLALGAEFAPPLRGRDRGFVQKMRSASPLHFGS